MKFQLENFFWGGGEGRGHAPSRFPLSSLPINTTPVNSFLRLCVPNDFILVYCAEMPEISAFKNYTPGDPTCRLYIKNLAKTVEEKVRDSPVH